MEKRLQRRAYLERQFSDEQLETIITDTYSFIKDVLNDPTLEHGYCKYEVEEDTTSYISLNLVGGHHSDTLFKDSNNRIISRYIMRKIFGNGLDIDIKEDLYDFSTGDEDIMSFDHRFSIYIQNFPKNINEIKEELLKKNKVLVK